MTTINSIHDPAPNTQELVGLTGLRGVAALMVLAFHLFAFAEPREIALNIAGDRYELHWLITGGFMGVHIFFVLSGFLLTLPFARHALGQRAGVNLSRYVSRRLWRVFPAYWTQLIILVVAAYLMTQRIPSFETLLAHIAMFPIAWKLEYADAINNVYWTLPTELSFYFLLPIIVFVVGRMAATGLRKWIIAGGVLLLAAIIYRYLAFQMVHDSPIPERVWLIGQLPGYIDLFAYGMLAAFAVIKLEGQPTRFYARYPNVLFIAGVAGVLLCMYSVHRVSLHFWHHGHWLLFFLESFSGFAIVLVILGVVGQGKLPTLALANPVIRYIGLISYSVYLWHYPVQRWITIWLAGHWPGDKLWPLVFISVPLTLVVASISYFAIEAPFLKQKSESKVRKLSPVKFDDAGEQAI